MIARELAQPVGLVKTTDTVLEVAKRMVSEGLPGLAVISGDDRPLAVLPAHQVLGLAVPAYIKDDPSLARVVDEAAADRLVDELGSLTIREVLDDAEPDLLGTVTHDATLLEVACTMSQLRVSFLVVASPEGKALGMITAQDVLSASMMRT